MRAMDVSRLASMPLFEGVSRSRLTELARSADEVDLPAGKALASEGVFAYEFVIIEEGQAEVTQDGRHVRELGPGDFLGEIGLLESARRTATVTTTSTARVIVMSGPDFRAMVRETPAVAARIRDAIEQRLGHAG